MPPSTFSPSRVQEFNFIRTIGEHRKCMGERFTTPTWVNITTITMHAKLGTPIDVQKLRAHLEDGEMELAPFCCLTISQNKKTFKNQLTTTMRMCGTNKSVKFFHNGSIHVTGATGVFECEVIIDRIHQNLLPMLTACRLPRPEFHVTLINSCFSLRHEVDLYRLIAHVSQPTHGSIYQWVFTPETYSGLRIKFQPFGDGKFVTTSVFSSGNVIITGSKTLKEVAFAYRLLTELVYEAPGIIMEPNEPKSKFEKSRGANCWRYDVLFEWAHANGFRSWLDAPVDNTEIKF